MAGHTPTPPAGVAVRYVPAECVLGMTKIPRHYFQYHHVHLTEYCASVDLSYEFLVFR